MSPFGALRVAGVHPVHAQPVPDTGEVLPKLASVEAVSAVDALGVRRRRARLASRVPAISSAVENPAAPRSGGTASVR
jgi:hypothetical protein